MTCPPFDVVRGDVYVTEATFGLPIYRWDEPAGVVAEILEEVLARAATPVPRASPIVEAATWSDLATARGESRSRNVKGFMLKRLASPYRAGRRRGDWWKWKIAP